MAAMQVTVYHPDQAPQVVQTPDWDVLLRQSAGVTWVDLHGPTQEGVRLLSEVFQFHPLAIEDATNQRQRPKIEEYDGYLFAIMNPVTFEHDEVQFTELDVFFSANYVVTVHAGDLPLLKKVEDRIVALARMTPQATGFIVYALFDAVVDSYFPVLDRIGEEIDDIEEQILNRPQQELLNRLFTLKRAISELWRVAGQQRDMFSVFSRHSEIMSASEALGYYLRDVYDHLIRITDTINTFRDILTSYVDLYMSAVSNRLNLVVNRLTIITIGVGLLTVISGFYGMNFARTWPPFESALGVPFVLALMMLVIIGILLLLRRQSH